MLLGIWELPGSGIEPVSPALAGGLSTREPPGKPQEGFKKKILGCAGCSLLSLAVVCRLLLLRRMGSRVLGPSGCSLLAQ